MNDRKKKIRDAVLGGSKPRAQASNTKSGLVVSGGIVVGGNVTVFADSNIHISSAERSMSNDKECISPEQATMLRELVHEVARLERAHAHNPVSVPLVWIKLKEKMQVTSYKHIPQDQYDIAVQTLLSWQVQAFRDRARTKQSLDVRAKMFRRCHGIAKRYGLYAEMRTLMRTKWKTDTMRQLEDIQLQELLAFMLALEAQYKA